MNCSLYQLVESLLSDFVTFFIKIVKRTRLNDPYHKVLTDSQKELTKGMEVGDSINIKWPHPEGFIYPTTLVLH